VSEFMQIVVEPEDVDVEESTSQGSASKWKKVSRLRKIKLIPLYCESEEVASISDCVFFFWIGRGCQHSPSSSLCSFE
jgi:hypothetical protein